MSILVTGASGNVGAYVVQSLLELNEEVVVAGTDVNKLQKMFGTAVKCVYLDFTKTETFETATHAVDRVFLMRPPHLGRPEDLYPFIDHLKTKPIRLISFLSLMGIEKNTIPPHHKIEKNIEQAGLPYAHIRPGFFMQNISGIHAQEICEENLIYIPAGKSKTSFIDAKDIGLATATILHDDERYRNTAHTLTGSESLDYDQVAAILSEVTQRKIRYAQPSFFRYWIRYVFKRKLNLNYVNVTLALYLMTRLGTAKRITNTFFELTGREPRMFKAFASEHLACFNPAKFVE